MSQSVTLTPEQAEHCGKIGRSVSDGVRIAVDFHRKYKDFIEQAKLSAQAVNRKMFPVETVGAALMGKFNTIEEGK